MDEEFTTQRTIELEPGQVACVLTLRKKLSVFDRVVSHKRGNTWHLSSCDSKFPMITNAKQVPAFQQAFERLTAKRKPGRQDKG